jgi:hypothetical protein
MTSRLNHAQLLAREEIASPPALSSPRACDSRSFDLPGGIYAAMVLLIGGAFAVLAAAFRTNMLVSFGVIFALLTAFFKIPAIFVKASPRESARAPDWDAFLSRGIDTATGATRATEATVLVLVLPFLILCWAIAVAIIAAAVR